MFQEQYQKAIKFAGEKHKHQQVPGTDSNYLLHVSNVAMEVMVAYHKASNFDIEAAIQIALLHDTLEDTPTTYEDLRELFGYKVAEGVKALTKDSSLGDKHIKMKDSLERIAKCKIKEAAIVKLADRITNMQKPPKTWSVEKSEAYYFEALTICEALGGYNNYLGNRLEEAIESYKKYLYK